MFAHARLRALATAVPQHVLTRDDVIRVSQQIFMRRAEELERLLPVYVNAGVDKRHSCVPADWYLSPVGWAERNALFVHHAVELAAQAVERCLDQAGLAPDEIDHLVVVSTSGIATPSLDARLMERLPLRRDTRRLPIFGLGCAGGVLGLSRAAAMARAHPGQRIMLVVVELCGLTFRAADKSNSNIVATALFGDGAAAALLCTNGDGPRLTDGGEHTWPNSLDVMGWTVEEDGLGVLFSRDIPSLVRQRFRAATDGFLDGLGLSRGDVARFVCHPGGTKVVQAIEEALELPQGELTVERGVLREFGNMSAATVLFVLERALSELHHGRALITGLGPGFSAGFQMLEPA